MTNPIAITCWLRKEMFTEMLQLGLNNGRETAPNRLIERENER